MYKIIILVNNPCEEMIMRGIWENSEVKELFSVVEDFKEKNKSLREAFQIHAQKYGRKPNSVRNYYYHEVDNLKEDNTRLKNLGINLDKHNKTSISYFSQEEEENLMKNIDKMVKSGVSVRKACYTLSNGDVGQMLRFQNKYRNFLSKRAKSSTEKMHVYDRLDDKNNIVEFRKVQKTLSDNEVQSLFMGLVRLVKKTALEESEERFRRQINEANENLRKTIQALNNKERDVFKLKEELLRIKKENSSLADCVLKLRCEKANKLRIKLQREN